MAEYHYTTGGTVQAEDGGLYLSRPADQQLLALCRQSRFAYVLSPRQLGKSSLMNRTAKQLLAEGFRAVMVDLTQIGTHAEAEIWYGDVLEVVADQLELATDARAWWKREADSGLTLRLTRFFEEVVLAEVSEPIVIFIDEIDTTLSLAFTDDFFAAIRYFYVARAQNPALRRLSFVLIGVATPADLIRDPKRTPFNIGERVDLRDFTAGEAAPLAEGLPLPLPEAERALGWILGWTGGHPYLSQRLCSVLAEEPPAQWSEAAVDQAVERTFFGERSEQDNNLQFVRDMLTKRAPQGYGTELLRTYRSIWQGRQPVADEEQNLVHAHLRLAGVVRRDGHQLVVRNRLYQSVFNAAWIDEHNPEDFWKRYGPVLKWAVPVSVFAVLVAGVMTSLWLEARRQTTFAEQAQQRFSNALVRANREALRAEREKARAKASETKAVAREKDTRRALAQLRQAQQQERQALTTAEQQRLRAEQEALVARQQQGRAEQQTRIGRQLTRIAQIREQVERVGNLLPTADAFFGMLLSIDAWDQSRSFASLHTSSAQALMHALQKSREANWLLDSAETNNVKISRDGSRIVGVFRGGIGIWDGRSGALIRTLEEGRGVTDVAISGDGSRIAGMFKGGIGIWNVKSGALIRTLEAGGGTDVAISGDGRRIVGGMKGGIVRIWDIEGGALLRTLQEVKEVAAVAISADGNRIVDGLFDQPTLRIWDVKSGALIREYRQKSYRKGISALAISGDGNTIVFAGQGITLPSILDVESGRVTQLPLFQLSTPAFLLDTVAISHDGRRIVTSSLEGPVQIWDYYYYGHGNASYGREAESMSIGREYTSSVAISGDGNRIVAIPLSRPGRVWDMKSEAIIQALQGGEDAQVKAISSDGSRAVGTFLDNDGKVGIWDVMSGALIRSLEAGGSVTDVSISSDGRLIAVAVDSKPVRIVDVRSGAVIRTLPRSMVKAISSNGRNAVGTLHNQKVEIWNLMSGALLHTLELGKGVAKVWISGDGSRIVGLFAEGGGIGIWNAKSGALIRTLEAGEGTDVAISGDGRRIAVAVDSNPVRIVDGRSGSVLQTLQGSDNPTEVAISSDGNWVVGVFGRGLGRFSNTFMQMWDAKSGRPFTPQIKIDGADHIAVNGDGSRIFILSENKVHQWMGSPEGWLDLACQRIWYHPQLRQPEKFMSDHEKVAVARRARGVCERVVGHGLKQQRFDPAHWLTGFVHRIAGIFRG